jgi:hypothetical protein
VLGFLAFRIDLVMIEEAAMTVALETRSQEIGQPLGDVVYEGSPVYLTIALLASLGKQMNRLYRYHKSLFSYIRP